jgi:hypothetical protein
MQKFYPQLDPRALNALVTIKQLLEQDEGYLNDPSCNYDPELKAQLQGLLAPKVVEIEVPVEVVVEKIVEIEKIVEMAAEGGKTGPKGPTKNAGSKNIGAITAELIEVQKDIRQLKMDSKGLMPADKIQILKTRAALVEKMITLEERSTNIKKVSMFMSVVMGILDDAFTDEQRQIFMKRLAPFEQED